MVELSVEHVQESFFGRQALLFSEPTEPQRLRMSPALEEELGRTMAGSYLPTSVIPHWAEHLTEVNDDW